MKIEVDADKLVILTEDHGGYLAGECIVCKAGGWYDGSLGYRFDDKDVLRNHLIHKKSCPVNKAIKKG